MLRLFKIVFVLLAVAAGAPMAAAHEWYCPYGACLPSGFHLGYPIGKVHNFHPRPRDGSPVVNDYPEFPEAYHGVGCVWGRRSVLTPQGPAWTVVPYCLDY